jgi:hypothetical protein
MTVRTRREPHPALQGLLDAPLKLTLSAAVGAAIEELRGQVRAADESTDWLAIYDQGLGVTEQLLADLDAQLEAMEQRALTLPDPGEIRQKQLVGRQKSADEVRARIRTDLNRTTNEWLDRLKRQQAQVHQQCVEMMDEHFKVHVETEKRSVTVSVDPTCWEQLEQFMGACADSWTEQAGQGADQQLTALLDARDQVHGAERVPWTAPVRSGLPAVDGAPLRLPRPEHGNAPTTLGALGSFLRSNVLLVSMFGMMLGAPIAFVFGLDLGGGKSGMLRGGVVVAAMPFLSIFGAYAGRTKRRQAIEKLDQDGHRKLRDATERNVGTVLDAQRDRNGRWIRARATELENALAEWWEIAVVPALAQVEVTVKEAAQKAKIDHRRLSDEHAKLKRTRDDVAGKLLFDLRRHHRELGESGAG